MSASALEQLINDELRWRETELALLKIQLLRDVRSPEHFPVSYRSFVAITYAHYEGFIKVCIAQAVSDIFQSGVLPSECVAALQNYYFAHQARKRLSALSNSQFVSALLGSKVFFDQTPRPTGEDILAISNMNVQTFIETTGSIGLSIASFGEFRRTVGRLVDLRHRCAHGERLTFDSSKSNADLAQDVFELQTNIVLLMHATALALLEFFENEEFLCKA